MEANHKRTIKRGVEFNSLFPKPVGGEIEIKHDADVSATVEFIPQVVFETLSDTNKIAKLLKGKTLDETCSNIWHFVYDHIQYEKDEDGVEQIRRPARAWHDRTRGVDCDCYTVFISSILTNLDIPHTYRITKYKNKDYFQHIYPIVPAGGGKYITIDCVVSEYNYEEPYTDKKDTPMKLHYLNGIENEQNKSLMENENVDIHDLMGMEDFDDLGKINFKKFTQGVKNAVQDLSHPKQALVKLKEGATKALHVVNKVNPATALLRVGVLASMKLNLFKIGGNLRHAYLTDAQAQAKDFDLDKLGKLRNIRKKLEDIFFGAGGQPDNLKKAILTGRGNKDNEVSGLGQVYDTNDYDENTPLSILLTGIYEEEGMEGLGSLGEPVTAASITAASSAMAIIAGLIKQIGGLKKGNKEAPAGEEGSKTENVEVDDAGGDGGSNSSVARNRNGSTDSSDSGSAPNEFLEKTKAWVKENPVQAGAVGIVVVAAIGFGIKHILSKKKKNPNALAGIYHKKHKKTRGSGKAKQKHHKTPIVLL